MATQLREGTAIDRVPDDRGAVLARGDHSGPVRAEGRAVDPPRMSAELLPAESLGRPPGGNVPGARGPVCAAGDQPAPVGAERNAPDGALVPDQDALGRAGIWALRPPDSRRPIEAAGHDAGPLRAEGDRGHLPGVPAQLDQDLTGPSVTDSGCAVPARGHDALAVRAEYGARDLTPVAGEAQDGPPRGDVPDTGRVVAAGGHQSAPVGTEGHVEHRPDVTAQLLRGLVSVRIPQPSGRVHAGRGDAPAVRAEHRVVDAPGMATEPMIVLAVSASKTRAVLSRLPVSTHRPSGLNDALYTEWRWPRSSAIDRPVPASQMRAVWSKLAVTTRPLSGLKTALQTAAVRSWLAVATKRPSGLTATSHSSAACPRSTASSCPVPASQTRPSWSKPPVTIVLPSGLKTAIGIWSECPRSSTDCPLRPWPSQMRAVPSSLAVTMRSPSGLNLALRTAPAWPWSLASSLAVRASQMRAVASPLAVPIRPPSGLKTALHTQSLWPRSFARMRHSSSACLSAFRASGVSLCLTASTASSTLSSGSTLSCAIASVASALERSRRPRCSAWRRRSCSSACCSTSWRRSSSRSASSACLPRQSRMAGARTS